MREFRSSGSVRGVPSNGHPYRDICSQLSDKIEWIGNPSVRREIDHLCQGSRKLTIIG